MNTNANAILDGHIVIRRILAIVIDSLILSMGMLFVNMNFGSLHVTGGTIPGSYTAVYVVDWIWYMIIPFAYFCILEANFSTTIGKRLMGLKVVDGAGQPITLLAAFLRNLLRFIDIIPGFYLVGGMIMRLTPQRQRLGDLAVQTMVVSSVSAPVLASSPQRSARLAAIVCCVLLIVCAISGYFARPAQVIQEMRFTHQSLFDDESMTAFTLGNPSWGIGTVTYPVRYRDQVDGRIFVCQGEISLNFIAVRGWSSDHSGTGCQAIN